MLRAIVFLSLPLSPVNPQNSQDRAQGDEDGSEHIDNFVECLSDFGVLPFVHAPPTRSPSITRRGFFEARFNCCKRDSAPKCESRLLKGQLCSEWRLWQNFFMTQPSLPISHEQRKIERLLTALAKKKPISAKPAPIASRQSATGTAHPRLFFST